VSPEERRREEKEAERTYQETLGEHPTGEEAL
jgi:hypothetical protein